MKQRTKVKTNRGITLIALVITIIVLLILAGVAIVTLTGENGILNQAGSAKEATEKAQAEEEVKLAIGNLQIEENQRNLEQNEKAGILEQELKELYSKQEPTTTVNISGEGFKISHRGYEFNIDSKYNVSYKEPFNAEEWDNDATPEDCFYWASNDPNEEGYGTVIGYTKDIDNYPILRFPSRCTKIEFSYDKNYDEVTNTTSRAFTNNIQRVEIPGTVTLIDSFAFGVPTHHSFQNLKEVEIEEGLIEIREYAFDGCVSLTSIEMPDSVTSIGRRVFGGCTNLKTITISDNVISVGDLIFEDTAWYNEQPDGLIYVGKVAYKYKGTMPSNTNIQIKDGTTGIAIYAFNSCTNLTSITIPNSVTNIGAFAFWGWTSSQTINIQGYTSTPSGWDSNWNSGSATINWGQ